MTDKQALAEARRRWGPRAFVVKNRPGTYNPEYDAMCAEGVWTIGNPAIKARYGEFYSSGRCEVGEVSSGFAFVNAEGDTWESAFRRVDEKAQRKLQPKEGRR